jgi:hypothetical protein
MSPDDNTQQVDARDSDGVQLGSGNVQNNNYYNGASTTAPPVYIPRPLRRRTPERLTAALIVGVAAALVAGVVVAVVVIANTNTSHQRGGNSQSLSPAAESSPTSALSPQQSPSPQQAPTASPSRSPTDPMAGAMPGDCFMNNGTEQNPDLQPDPSCLDGDFDVAQVLPDTTDTSGCDATAPQWGVADSTDDQVLCLSYQDAGSAYNAAVNDCVSASPGQTWSTVSCSIGNFTVLDRYTGATADNTACGSGSDWYASFQNNGYPNLNVMLCLQMNYPPIATAPVGTCIYHIDFSSYKDFNEVPCGSANSYVSGHSGTYDPSQCGSNGGTYGWYWWFPPGYPSLGVTTCLRPAN